MNWLAVAAVNLALAVVTGAFGAHALRDRLSVDAAGWWQTAVQYHFIHALGLLALGMLLRDARAPAGLGAAAVWLQLGIVLFSGSLYAMALGAPRLLGAVAPLGGTAFIIGWLTLAWQAGRG